MKKLKYGIVFCLFLLGVDIYFVNAIKDISEEQNIAKTEVFETFEKKDKEIIKRKSTVKEILKLQTLRPKSRKVATIKDKSSEVKRRGERVLIGQNNTRLEDVNKPIKILNKYNKEWKNLLSKQILDFLPVGTKTIIKRNEGFVKVVNNRGVLLEKAIVSIQLPNKGPRSSYNALIDSSNGRILHTWNASRAEVDGFPIILEPKGMIYAPKMPRK